MFPTPGLGLLDPDLLSRLESQRASQRNNGKSMSSPSLQLFPVSRYLVHARLLKRKVERSPVERTTSNGRDSHLDLSKFLCLACLAMLLSPK
jgi:hypothetical protein